MQNNNYEVIEFEDTEAFRVWIDKNHRTTSGIWLKLHKKSSGLTSISYAEALDIALCFGWIDGMRRSYDDFSFLQKITPRRPRSLWSKRNIEHVTRLIDKGLMTSAGLEEVERAQADGRWATAYDGPSTMTFSKSFLAELNKYPEAEAYFNSLTKSARFTIGLQLQTAKTQKTLEARQARAIQKLLDKTH